MLLRRKKLVQSCIKSLDAETFVAGKEVNSATGNHHSSLLMTFPENRQVETTVKSLNQGDVFILDCGDPIYQFNGSKAGRMCKVLLASFD